MESEHIHDKHNDFCISVFYDQPKQTKALAQHIYFTFQTRDNKEAYVWFVPESRWTVKVRN